MERYERQAAERGFRRVAGLDEAGRGPLAGPVVAAAVILPPTLTHPHIVDSKQLPASRRLEAYEWLMATAVARHVGARFVVVTDVNEYRLELAREMGATSAVNVAHSSIAETMATLGMTEGYDV
ncbi:MAG: zinc-binding dehydrogenase, partial [Nitrospinota bacterium]